MSVPEGAQNVLSTTTFSPRIPLSKLLPQNNTNSENTSATASPTRPVVTWKRTGRDSKKVSGETSAKTATSVVSPHLLSNTTSNAEALGKGLPLSVWNATPPSQTTVLVNGRMRDTEYYSESVVFEVEGCLFKVAKRQFETSTFFQSHFATSPGTDEHPIKLGQVTKAGFRALLRFLYPPSYGMVPFRHVTVGEWSSILQLSSQWKMNDVRNEAKRQLEFLHKTLPIEDRVVLARNSHVVEWLRDAYVNLAFRIESISSVDEITKLGSGTIFNLHRIRDRIIRGSTIETPCAETWDAEVKKKFEYELKMSPCDTIKRAVLAKECNAKAWLVSSYADLVSRDTPLTDEEASKLTFGIAIKIGRARETSLRAKSTMLALDLVEEEMRVELAQAKDLTVVEEVLFARQCMEPEWLKASLIKLAKRGQVTDEESQKLGLSTAIAIYQVRRIVYCKSSMTDENREEYKKAVDVEFAEEFEAVRRLESGGTSQS